MTAAPVAENMMNGVIHFDDRSDMQPGDQIRIGVDPAEHFYEIIAIDDDNSIDLYDHEVERFETVSKSEFEDRLREPCFLWKLLYREIIPINDDDDSLLLYTYAAEYPDIDGRVIHFGWVIEDEHPPTTVGTFDELGNYGTFEDLHDELHEEENAFGGLLDKFTDDSDMDDILEKVFYASEYNASKFFTLQTDPMYSEEEEEQLSEYATGFSG